MSTLAELFEKHGSVWLATNGEKRFKPMVYSEDKSRIIGQTDRPAQTSDSFPVDMRGFEEYQEPRKFKQVTLLGWVYNGSNFKWMSKIPDYDVCFPAYDSSGKQLEMVIYVEE